MDDFENWLQNEDKRNFDDRLVRLRWLGENLPGNSYWTFHGGRITKYLFEEARYCFVYGQYLATIILGLSFIEHTLAALFYASGRNELEKASISKLINEAQEVKWISKEEFANLNHAREIRNPIVHFRSPGGKETLEYRSVIENAHPYSLLENDASNVMKTVFHLLGKTSV